MIKRYYDTIIDKYFKDLSILKADPDSNQGGQVLKVYHSV